jgi:isoamylase
VRWETADQDLLEFTRRLIHFRLQHPVFRRRNWFHGQPIHGDEASDIGWFTPDGIEMAEENWGEGFAKALGIYLNGKGIQSVDEQGEPILDNSFYLMFNAYDNEVIFTLPDDCWGKDWVKVFDTSEPGFTENGEVFSAEDQVVVQGRSVVVLRLVE